mgnify:FL=1
MAWCTIQLDDYETTHSTGGVVIEKQEIQGMLCLANGSDKVIKECPDNVKVGWIYTDKTHQFVDSNVSNN